MQDVFVIALDGTKLMPTNRAKARKLLKKGKEKYAITVLPVRRNGSIPHHRVLRRLFKMAREDSLNTINTIQAYLNRQYMLGRF